ncbi:MAG: DMT family transporter [Paracoccaceae bacterium]
MSAAGSAAQSAPNRPVLAALWMIGALIGFSSMAIAGRELAAGLDTFEIMFYRSGLGLVTILLVSSAFGTRHTITARAMPLHFARNISHFIGQNLWLYALTLIPLAQLFAVEFTSPVIVALLAPLLLNERMSAMRALTAALGFIGILIVANPFDGAGLSPGVIAAILCAFGFAGSIIFTKKLTSQAHASVTCILFWLSVIQLGLGAICAGFDGDIALPTFEQLPWLALIGLAGLGAHFSLTTALSLAPATVVIPVDFLRLPLIAIIGMNFYAEPFAINVFIGAALIFGANYINILREARAAKKPRPS